MSRLPESYVISSQVNISRPDFFKTPLRVLFVVVVVVVVVVAVIVDVVIVVIVVVVVVFIVVFLLSLLLVRFLTLGVGGHPTRPVVKTGRI